MEELAASPRGARQTSRGDKFQTSLEGRGVAIVEIGGRNADRLDPDHLKEVVPHPVGKRMLGMMRTVDLDAKRRFGAVEVEDIASDRNLPLEEEPKLLLSELSPEQLFAVGHFGAQLSSPEFLF